MIDTKHPFVGSGVVYRDPYGKRPEQGIITSVDEENNTVFVRYGLGSSSAGTTCDERLTFLNGKQVILGVK